MAGMKLNELSIGGIDKNLCAAYNLLAGELKCSTQPVFHAFRNMEELKEEVYKKTQKLFEETMLQQPSDTETPFFLSM